METAQPTSLLDNLLVLLVEDDDLLRQSYTEILHYNNMDVLAARNGKEAINMLEDAQPDVVICDRMMPEMSGDELVEHIRQHPRHANLPFIFISAKTSRTDVRAGMNMGADDYLTKPFRASEMLEAIEARMKRYYSETYGANSLQETERLKALLSKQELAIFTMIAEGALSQDIADRLFISIKTVENHRANIGIKLGLSGKNSLLRFALENKLLIKMLRK